MTSSDLFVGDDFFCGIVGGGKIILPSGMSILLQDLDTFWVISCAGMSGVGY